MSTRQQAELALREVANTLSIDLSEAQSLALHDYVSLLLKWNRVYNLTAIREPQEVWTHHIYDSMAAVPAMLERDAHVHHILDVGSGGGLPGVVWAILRPDWQVDCLDAVAKKMAFVQQVIHATPTVHGRMRAWHTRVQEHKQQYDLVTSRAFASLADFVIWTRHLLKPNAHWMAMKGKWPQEEIDALPADVEVFHVKQLHVPQLDEERWLIWMRLKA